MATKERAYLAVDLGASSGRVLAGLLDGDRLRLEECYRFENGPVAVGRSLHWDLLRQWSHIQAGLRAAAVEFPGQAVSVGVDTWGVDFALLGRGDELLGNPYHYRDSRTAGILDRAFEIVPREEIFDATGLQFMEFNTLYQLLAMRQHENPLLEAAESLLLMPDVFHWLLTGEKTNEMTDVSTTQMFDPRSGDWATGLIERFGLPTDILGTITPPGSKIGPLRSLVSEATGLRNVEVVLPGTHDTASAVVAVPAEAPPSMHPNWCYISSGTWSLMGAETTAPIIDERSRRYNFTNEGGVGGTIRLLKNIAGLWLVQECRRVWASRGHEFGWDALVYLAEKSEPLVSLVNPDDPRFMAPADMPAEIQAYCRETQQPVPESEGAIIRCALESVAMRYRQVLAWLEEVLGNRIETMHIVGGGTQNQLLCQMAADACNRRIVAGPVEATALGNVVVQAMAAGQLDSIQTGRRVIRECFDVVEYQPRSSAAWDAAVERVAS